MKTYTINKTFKNEKALEKWKAKNCPDRMYNGECVMMITSEGMAGEDKVVLKEIITI